MNARRLDDMEPPPEIRAKLLELHRNHRPEPVLPVYDGPPIHELEFTAKQLEEFVANPDNSFAAMLESINRDLTPL